VIIPPEELLELELLPPLDELLELELPPLLELELLPPLDELLEPPLLELELELLLEPLWQQLVSLLHGVQPGLQVTCEPPLLLELLLPLCIIGQIFFGLVVIINPVDEQQYFIVEEL
jgi:hypothetical protein